MITFIPPRFTTPVWKPIDLGDGASIEIAIRRPTLSEQLASWDRSSSSSEFMLRSVVTDWRGVHDTDGKPVPYTFEKLGLVAQTYPTAIWSILDAVTAARETLTETDLKNSPTPPANGGTTTPDETTTSTMSSACIASSAEPNSSVNDSASPVMSY